MTGPLLRKPTVGDVADIVELIKDGVERDVNLPRSRHYVCENLRDFVVSELDGHFVGCASLHVLWKDFAEIRAVAHTPGPEGDDAFERMIAFLIEDARRLGIERVLVFAFNPRPFLPLGFVEVERESLPQIAWRECMDCVYFPKCRETALLLELGKDLL